MMPDLNNVFHKTAPLYLHLIGGLSAGLIGGTDLMLVAMNLGAQRDKHKT